MVSMLRAIRRSRSGGKSVWLMLRFGSEVRTLARIVVKLVWGVAAMAAAVAASDLVVVVAAASWGS